MVLAIWMQLFLDCHSFIESGFTGIWADVDGAWGLQAACMNESLGLRMLRIQGSGLMGPGVQSCWDEDSGFIEYVLQGMRFADCSVEGFIMFHCRIQAPGLGFGVSSFLKQFRM